MSAAVTMRCVDCGSLDLVSSALVKFNTGDVVEYDSHPTHCAECLSTKFRAVMSPSDFLEAGLWAAVDNAHDMLIGPMHETEYAFGVIVMDVMWGAADSYPDSGYLNVQYDDDDREVRFTRGDLRPHLLAVIAEAVKRTEAES